jgi:hypothetical protein
VGGERLLRGKKQIKTNQTYGRRMKIKVLITGVACAMAAVLVTGCSSVTRGTPNAGLVINANMDKNDYEVLGNTEGKSTKTSVLCGLVSVIDGDKISVLGLKFFEDQYAFEEKARFGFVSVDDRAYYKALAATPDADAVARKSLIRTESGIPCIWMSREATYSGKAVKYKVHN